MLGCWLILVYFRICSSLPFHQLVRRCAYMGTLHTLCTFTCRHHSGTTPSLPMQAYNAAMSGVRTSVEWLFGDIINYFKFLDFKKNLKIQLSSVGKMYVVCAILRNALTCLYGNQISEFFEMEPPTLQECFI